MGRKQKPKGKRDQQQPSRRRVKRAAAAEITTIGAVVARPKAALDLSYDRFQRIAGANAEKLEARLLEKLPKASISGQAIICRLLAKVAPAPALAHLLDLTALPKFERISDRFSTWWAMWVAMFEVNRAKLPLDRQKAFEALKPHVGREDIDERLLVLQMLALLELPKARELLRGILDDPDIKVRARAAEGLAENRDAAGWAVLKEVLTTHSPDYDWEQRNRALLALRELIQIPNPELREQILTLARSETERLLPRSNDEDAYNQLLHLIDVVEAGAPDWLAEFLSRVASAQMPFIGEHAFEKLLKLGSQSALPAISNALRENVHVGAAFKALNALGPSAATPEIVSAIDRFLRECKPGRQADMAYRALVALGCDNLDVVKRVRYKLSSFYVFFASIRLRGLDGAGVLDLLLRMELVDANRIAKIGREACIRLLSPQPAELNLVGSGFTELLYKFKALHTFDREGSKIPPDYVSLLADLADLAAPRFSIVDASLQPDATDEGHQVMFLFEDTPTSFIARDFGDWFDVDRLLEHLNGLIAAMGRPERFAALDSGDQMSLIVLGHGERMMDAKREFGFPLAEPPDTGRFSSPAQR